MSLTDLVSHEMRNLDGIALDYIIYKRCRGLLESAVKKGGCELYFSDVAQNVLMKFYDSSKHTLFDDLARCRSDNEVKRFLYEVFYNAALDSWKECYGQCRKSENAQAVRNMVCTSPDISQLYEEYPEMEGSYVQSSKKDAQMLHNAINRQLSNPLDREVYYSRRRGDSAAQIVKNLAPRYPKINVGAVNNRYKRIKDRLRISLSEEYPEYCIA